MKKISFFLKFLATGTMSLMLTACYGVMYELQETESRIGRFQILKNNEPIEGIMVVYNDVYGEIDYSDEQGLVQYDLSMELDKSIDVFLYEKDLEGNYLETGIKKELDDDDSTIDPITLD